MGILPSGKIDCKGGFGSHATFCLKICSSDFDGMVVSLRNACDKYLRCLPDGQVDGHGSDADDTACHFNLVDVETGVALRAIGATGTGYVCVGSSGQEPLATTETPECSFRLLAEPQHERIPAQTPQHPDSQACSSGPSDTDEEWNNI